MLWSVLKTQGKILKSKPNIVYINIVQSIDDKKFLQKQVFPFNCLTIERVKILNNRNIIWKVSLMNKSMMKNVHLIVKKNDKYSYRNNVSG